MNSRPPEPYPFCRPSEDLETVAEYEALRRRAERNARLMFLGTAAAPAGMWAVATFVPPVTARHVVLGLGFLAWLCCLVICAGMLWQWVWTRERPVLSLDPRAERRGTPWERTFYLTLRRRPALGEAEFYEAFYAGTPVPPDWPGRAIAALARGLGWEAEELRSLHPRDELILLDLQADWLALAHRVSVCCGAPFADGDLLAWDGTLDGLFVLMLDAGSDEPDSA